MKRTLAIVSMLLLWQGNPRAREPGKQLDQADKLMSQMKYEKALKLINQVLVSAKSGPAQLVKAYRLRGMCLAGAGKNDKAVDAFRRLFAIDPRAQLPPSTSPAMRWPFDKARSMRGLKAITLDHTHPPAPKRLKGFSLRVSLDTNPFDLVHTIQLRIWDAAKMKWLVGSRKRVKKTGSHRLKLPGKLKGTIEYYFEALNKHGGVLLTSGNPDQPHRLVAGPAKAVAKEPATKKPAEKTAKSPLEKKTATVAKHEAPKAKKTDPVKEESKPAPKAEKAPTVVRKKPEPPPPPVAPPAVSEPEEETEEATPWYTTWWFWTGVGVVAAGVVTGVAVAATSGETTQTYVYDISVR
jgi:hypothetical protein